MSAIVSPTLGEDHGVPHAFETHLFGGLQGGEEGDAEEPEGEGPDEALLLVSTMSLAFCRGRGTYIATRRASCFIISAIPGFSAKTP